MKKTRLAVIITLLLAIIATTLTPATAEAAVPYNSLTVTIPETSMGGYEAMDRFVVGVGKKVTFKVEKTYYGDREATIKPSNYKKEKVTFKSSNTKIFTVNSKGILTGKKVGKAKITVNSKYGKLIYPVEVTGFYKDIIATLKKDIGPNIEKLNDFDKAYAISLWTGNDDIMTYSTKNRTKDPEKIFERRYGACDEHSILYVEMCRALGLQCRRVTGMVPAGYHAWNSVKINDHWFQIDPQIAGSFGYNNTKEPEIVAKWDSLIDAYNNALENDASDEELAELEYDIENHPDSLDVYIDSFRERVGWDEVHH